MVQAEPPVRLFATDELGQLKVFQAPSLDRLDELAIVARWGQPDRTRAIQALSLSSLRGLTDTATATAALGRKDGSIDVLNPNTGEILWHVPSIHKSADETSSIETVNVSFSGPAAAAASPVVISCTAGGVARIHAAGDDEDDTARELASWKVPATVCCSALEESAGLFAVGSHGAELRLYNLALPDGPVFSGKGSKPDKLGLVDRPWNSAVAFFPGSNGTKIWTGTGHYKLRLYDTGASKKPHTEAVLGSSRITGIAPEPDGQRVWVSNAIGSVEMYDVRGGRFTGAINGIAGSVRDLAMHPEGKKIASVGLDRFLRVHDTTSRKSSGKVYLKTQLTGVAWCPADVGMAVLEKEERVDAEASDKNKNVLKRKEDDVGGSSSSSIKKKKNQK